MELVLTAVSITGRHHSQYARLTDAETRARVVADRMGHEAIDGACGDSIAARFDHLAEQAGSPPDMRDAFRPAH